MANKFIVLMLLLMNFETLAASCCGGSSGGVNLITNEATFKSSLTYSNKLYIADISSTKKISKRSTETKEIREVFNIGLSKTISNLGQVNFEIGMVKITKNTDEASSVSDIKTGYSYEFLPEIFYNAWKPRGFGYILIDLPVGSSKFEYGSKAGSDITSSGLYQVSLGLLFLKNIGSFEYKFSSSVAKPFNRQFNEEVYVRKDFGYNASLDLNYSVSGTSWSLGLSQGYQRMGSEKVLKRQRDTTSKPQVEFPTTFSISYQLSDIYSITGMYIENSIIKGAQNTSTYKQVSLALNIFRF